MQLKPITVFTAALPVTPNILKARVAWQPLLQNSQVLPPHCSPRLLHEHHPCVYPHQQRYARR